MKLISIKMFDFYIQIIYPSMHPNSIHFLIFLMKESYYFEIVWSKEYVKHLYKIIKS